MICAKSLSFSYISSESFIKDISLNIKSGEITTILGPNGCGKSTLLNMLCGVNKPNNGEILIDNKSYKTLKYKDLARKIATVHQQNSVPEDITVYNLVSYGRIPHKNHFKKSINDDNKIIEKAIKETNLDRYRDKKVMSLSGGERQRVFISMALAQQPKVLFLDEPTTYLDIYHQIEILELIKKLNKEQKMTIVMVLHDINQAIKYSHNLIIMKNGDLINQGTPKNIISKNLLKEVYNVDGILSNVEDEMFFIPINTN